MRSDTNRRQSARPVHMPYRTINPDKVELGCRLTAVVELSDEGTDAVIDLRRREPVRRFRDETMVHHVLEERGHFVKSINLLKDSAAPRERPSCTYVS